MPGRPNVYHVRTDSDILVDLEMHFRQLSHRLLHSMDQVLVLACHKSLYLNKDLYKHNTTERNLDNLTYLRGRRKEAAYSLPNIIEIKRV